MGNSPLSVETSGKCDYRNTTPEGACWGIARRLDLSLQMAANGDKRSKKRVGGLGQSARGGGMGRSLGGGE